MFSQNRLLPLLLVLTLVGGLGCSSSSSTRSSATDETISDGYTTQETSSVTSATSSFRPSTAQKDYARDIADLLQGNTAGVHVSSSPSGVRVLVRGPNSLTGSNTPLYILNGIPVSPNPNGTLPVNPQDVSSITVLKDAGATAIYGSRGANGVIVIETGN